MKVKFKIRNGKCIVDIQGIGTICETHAINNWIRTNFNVVSSSRKSEYYAEDLDESVRIGIKKN